MQYMRAYQFITDRANWLMNILMGVVCSFIPVVGEIVLDGYFFEMIESLHRDPEHKEYADFDFNCFTRYLGRGIWPWLVSFLLRFIVGIPIAILSVMAMAVGVVSASSKGSPAVFVAAYVFIIAMSLLSAMVLPFLTWPAMIHAGLSGEFNFAGMSAFVRDFLKRVKKELFLSILFMAGTGVVLYVVGVCAFLFGAIFTLFAANMAAHHLMFQLYELYLERGGTPIPTKAQREASGDDLPMAGPA